MHIARYIDHTLLKATATTDDIKKLCEEAIQFDFFSVCVNSSYVKLCLELVQYSNTKIASVVGFPLGAMDSYSKIIEAEQAIKNGAHEIDMVINIGLLKSTRTKEVEDEIKQIKKAIGDNILKVIIETCYLTDDEKRIATKITVDAGADFVKTSTGFGTAGATPEDVLLMKSVTENRIQIKASGGIRDYETAKRYIDLGVTRIGTSNGVQIVTGEKTSEENY